METKRIEYLDTAKGIAIFLMVMGHTIAWNYSDWNFLTLRPIFQTPTQVQESLLWKLIYSFHMPLFFMISGYLNYKPQPIKKIITKKIGRLLIPYIFTGFLLLLLRGYYGYWFLFSLFELSIIGAILFKVLKIVNKKAIYWIDIIAIVITFFIMRKILNLSFLENPFCDIGKASSFMLPFLFGTFLKKHTRLEVAIMKFSELFLLSFLILFLLDYLPLIGVESGIFELYKKYSGYLLCIIGPLMVIGILKRGINPHIQHFFSKIGKYTLEIYILHLFFVIQIPDISVFWSTSNFPTIITTQLLYSIIVSSIAILLSYFTARIIKRSKLLSKLLWGQ